MIPMNKEKIRQETKGVHINKNIVVQCTRKGKEVVRVRFRVRVKRHDGGVNTVVGWARGEARKGRRRR